MVEQEQPRNEIWFGSHRSLRRVPLKWEHPKDKEGNYIPLYDRSKYPLYTEEEIQEMIEDGSLSSREKLEAWFAPDFSNVPTEELGICAYENTTGGTPISPVFPDTPEGQSELLSYLSENQTVFAHIKSGPEGWAAILFGDAIVNLDRGSVEGFLPPQKDNP